MMPFSAYPPGAGLRPGHSEYGPTECLNTGAFPRLPTARLTPLLRRFAIKITPQQIVTGKGGTRHVH
jgi:hypothetical protein